MKISLLSAFVILPLAGFAQPADSGLVSDQTDVQTESIRLQAELKSILSEMAANNLPTQDRATVETLFKSLSTLNDTEMKNVVTLLKSGTSGVDTMTQVFKGQTNIESGLQALADRVSTENSITTVPARLESLLERQTGNLRETESLGRIQDAGGAARSPAGEVAVAEQTSVGDEMEQILSILESKALSDSAAQLSAKLLAAANAPVLRTDIAAAPKSLSAAQFPAATTTEKSILDTLQKMVAVSDKSQTLAARLQALHDSLSALVDDHSKVLDTVNGMSTSDHKVGGVESSLADRADLLRTKAEGISAATAVDLAKASDAMSKTADQLNAFSWDFKLADAKSGAANSDASLKKALADVDQQLAEANKEASSAAAPADQTPEQKYQALTQAESDLANLAKAQAAADPNNAAAQTDVANQAANVQKELAAVAPEAAPAVAKAAEASADASAPSASPADKQADSKEAAAQIAAADAAVKADMANIAADAKTSEALKSAVASLDAASSSLDSATAKMNSGNADALPQSVPDLKAASEAVANSQASAQAASDKSGSPDKSGNQAGQSAPDSGVAALAKASEALDQARNQAVMGNAAESKIAAASAKAKIDEARNALADALDKSMNKTAGGLTDKGTDDPVANNMGSRDAIFLNEDSPVVPDGTAAYGSPQYAGYVDGARKSTMQSLQHEGYPQEYAPLVQQYWKSLASSPAKP